MRSRLVVALVAVAACKGKSADKESTGAGSGPAVGMGSGGEKLAQEKQNKTGAVLDRGAPDQPTKVVVADGIQAAAPRGDATPERRAEAGASTGSASAPGAPAIPTPVTREDRIAAAPPKVDAAASITLAITAEKALDRSTLALEAVTAKIRSAYAPGLRGCAAGKSGDVSIAFTVNETGRVAAAASTAAFDDQVAACIVEKARGFEFPAPAAKARFAMTFQLRAP